MIRSGRAWQVRALAGIGAIAALVAIAQWRALDPNEARSAGTPAVDAAARGSAPTSLSWGPGTRYVFALVWTSKVRTQVTPGTEPMELESTLDSDLVVRSFGERDGAFELLLGLEEVRTFSSGVVGGGRGADERSELARHHVLVRVDRLGAIKALSFRASVPYKTRSFLVSLAGALRVTFPAERASTWTTLEPTALGTTRVMYEPLPDGMLGRRRLEYTSIPSLSWTATELGDLEQKLESSSAIGFDASGVLESITDEEGLAMTSRADGSDMLASRTHIALSRKGTSPFRAGEIDRSEFDQRFDDGKIVPTPQESDAQFAASVTPEKLAETLELYGGGANLPNGFVGRAAAYLRLHPETSRGLATTFELKESTIRLRALIADLLSVAGDAAAQASLREAITWGTSNMSTFDVAQCLQRFTFVVRPEPASASVVAAAYASGKEKHDKALRGAAVVTLGAMIGALRRQGLEDAARKHHELVVSDLARATAAEERAALLEALGNDAEAADARTIARYATDAATIVRDASAFALRHVDAPEAREALVRLLEDPSVTVGTSAAKALRTQRLTERDWATVERFFARTDGGTNPGADAALVETVRLNMVDSGAHGRAILTAVRARTSPGDADLLHTIDSLLGG